MTLREFEEIGDCDVCPFMRDKECPGGWKSGAGGEPIEPPCTRWPDDDLDIDIEDLLSQHYAAINAWENHMDEIEEAKRQVREKNAKRVETRKAMELYCVAERVAVKGLKKRIKALKKQEEYVANLANAFNFANEMFRYEERYTPHPIFSDHIIRLEGELALAEEAYKLKRKEFYAKRKADKK